MSLDGQEQDSQQASGQEQGDGHDEVQPPQGGAETLPVLAEQARVVPPRAIADEVLPARGSGGALPTVQAAAVAAGGFVAGAAVVGLVTRRQRRPAALAKGRRAGRRLARGRKAPSGSELIQIVGSRSLLLDVHLLGGRD